MVVVEVPRDQTDAYNLKTADGLASPLSPTHKLRTSTSVPHRTVGLSVLPERFMDRSLPASIPEEDPYGMCPPRGTLTSSTSHPSRCQIVNFGALPATLIFAARRPAPVHLTPACRKAPLSVPDEGSIIFPAHSSQRPCTLLRCHLRGAVCSPSSKTRWHHEEVWAGCPPTISENYLPRWQCHRCQKWEYAQRRCRATPRCVKCVAQHLTKDCTNPRKRRNSRTAETDKSGDVRTKPLTNTLTKASTAEKMTPLKSTKEDKESNKKKNNNLENQEGKKKEPAKLTIVARDLNDKHSSWHSRITTLKGRDLFNFVEQPNMRGAGPDSPGFTRGKRPSSPSALQARLQRQKRRRLLSLRDKEVLIAQRNKPDHDSSPETEQKLFRGGTQVDKIQLKQEKTEDQKMEEIKQILLELSREVKEMRNDINQNNEEMRSLREDVRTMQVNWEKEKLDLEEKITKTEEKIEKLEKDKIRNNLIMTGMRMETKNEELLRNTMEKMINKELSLNVKVKKSYKIGQDRYSVEMNNWNEKLMVLKTKGKLRGKEIYIDSALTLMETEIQKNIRDFAKKERINGATVRAKIENKQANITMINAYAPTENSKEEEKTKFYDKLEKVCEKVKRNDILMIVGDFNTKIGKEERNEGVAGKETIHDTTNDNAAKICDLAAATNTFIVSTQYRHKREHKITWMIPGGTEGNQIDHMLISKKWKRIIQDVRTYREENVDSDHLLVVAKMRMKMVKQTGEPGSGKSELGYETAIFFDGRTLRETERIGSCGSRFDETETSVDKTTPVPITPRGPVGYNEQVVGFELVNNTNYEYCRLRLKKNDENCPEYGK
ncbi:hypothetical protein GEV33_006135 [Tenebrio molitor]|uniref:Endonuclease/exonuclease/phosphatase domain-containing protein n=1 Tax=Tenebrio molitor TaxID=7067 RepID=A0A8J6HME3_TENMO|nr:hypothetical protein GEV33_006135 [Tenebrio molitor]